MKIIATILIFALCQISLAWKAETHTDEMTDAKQFVVWTTGTVVRINSLVEYTPQLQVRMTSPTYLPDTDKIRAKFELLFTIETEGLKRSGAEVMYRVDDKEPITEIWSPATDRHGAFSPHAVELIKELQTAQTLRIRYITTLGDIRTVRFDVTGLKDALKKAIAK